MVLEEIKPRPFNKTVIFWLFFLLYSGFTFFLFYQQAVMPNGMYGCDMIEYVREASGINTVYYFPYRIYFWLIQALDLVLPVEIAAASATVLLNSLNVFILYNYVALYLAPYKSRLTTQKGRDLGCAATTGILFFCLFVSMLVIPIPALYNVPGQYYLGQGTGNIWHNGTYLATRPFATASFFLFIELMGDLGKKPRVRTMLLFSVCLFLSTFTKPTFTFCFAPAAALVLLCSWIGNRFRNTKTVFLVGVTFLPAGAEIIRQFIGTFGSGSASSIAFGFGVVLGYYTANMLVSFLLAYAFPLFILLTNLRRLRDNTVFRMAWLVALVGQLQAWFLYQAGPRMLDGNFLWGSMHGLFYSFIACALLWVCQLLERERGPLAYHITAGTLALAHLASGIWYFVWVSMGKLYY